MHQPCELSDPALMLCLDFNDASTLGYDSASGHHDGSVVNVQPMTRDIVSLQDPAATFSTASSLQIAADPGLDLPGAPAFSIELWLDPTTKPNTTYHVLSQGQYDVALYPDGHVRCTIGSNYAETGPIPTGAMARWTHVGCAYDGANVVAYINGNVAACYQPQAWAPGTPSLAGVAIGAPLVAAVDNIHVLAREIGPDEMCMLAGKTDCQHDCPGGGGLPGGP